MPITACLAQPLSLERTSRVNTSSNDKAQATKPKAINEPVFYILDVRNNDLDFFSLHHSKPTHF